MEQGAVMLGKVAFAGNTVELTPETTTRMPIGAEVAQAQPAAIRTADMGAKVP
jgi:hypothetical protein